MSDAVVVTYGESVTLRFGPVLGLPEGETLTTIAAEIECQVKERLGQDDGLLDVNLYIDKSLTDDTLSIEEDVEDGSFVLVPIEPDDFLALPRRMGKFYIDVWVTTTGGERKPLTIRAFQVNGAVNLP
jgi:hypothetical protein